MWTFQTNMDIPLPFVGANFFPIKSKGYPLSTVSLVSFCRLNLDNQRLLVLVRNLVAISGFIMQTETPRKEKTGTSLHWGITFFLYK